MFYKLHRISLFAGLCANSGALILGQHFAAPDFLIGFLEGVAIAMLLGSLYFLRRARKAGEAEAQECACWLKGRKSGLAGKGDNEE
jgi:hypothetical protein